MVLLPKAICNHSTLTCERSPRGRRDFKFSSLYTANTLHWRHNDHDGVSNHQPHGCLLNRLFRHKSKKTSKLRVTGLCAGNSPGPVNSPHKGPVTRKMFPFDDVIMIIHRLLETTESILPLLKLLRLKSNVFHVSHKMNNTTETVATTNELETNHLYYFLSQYHQGLGRQHAEAEGRCFCLCRGSRAIFLIGMGDHHIFL